MAKRGTISCQKSKISFGLARTKTLKMILKFCFFITRIVFTSTSNFKSSTGWCLLTNWFWLNFLHTPTPVYAFRILLVESTIHKCTMKIRLDWSKHRFPQKILVEFQAGGAYRAGAYKKKRSVYFDGVEFISANPFHENEFLIQKVLDFSWLSL